ncbi:MAG: DMT family transporter [Alphaproteobacteria bacterium]|nr:DMT family transporter [Alphaproteobacteria bacterium]
MDQPKPAADPEGRAAVPRAALIALFAGAMAIGGSGILVRLAETGPVATGFYRVALAAPIFVLWAQFGRRPSGRPAQGFAGLRANMGLILLSGVLFAIDLGTFHWSISYTTVANATLLSNLTPIWVTLGAWLILRERIGGLFLAGLVIAIAGCAILMGRSFELSADRLFGDALATFASIFYGGYLLVITRLRARLSTPALMAASGIVTAVLLLPAALMIGERAIPLTLAGWMVLVGVALISQASGQGLIAFALAHLPASFSSVSLLVQPIAAALLAWLILGEALGPIEAAGGVVVLAGIWIAARASLVRRRVVE